MFTLFTLEWEWIYLLNGIFKIHAHFVAYIHFADAINPPSTGFTSVWITYSLQSAERFVISMATYPFVGGRENNDHLNNGIILSLFVCQKAIAILQVKSQSCDSSESKLFLWTKPGYYCFSEKLTNVIGEKLCYAI